MEIFACRVTSDFDQSSSSAPVCQLVIITAARNFFFNSINVKNILKSLERNFKIKYEMIGAWSEQQLMNCPALSAFDKPLFSLWFLHLLKSK